MSVLTLDPLTDPEWDVFTANHTRGSVFHSSRWLSALQDTYGYRPVAFTSCKGKSLTNALVACEVKSWITGRRLVSLPFSDYCDVLAESTAEERELLDYVCEWALSKGYAYVEFRPSVSDCPAGLNNLRPSQSFYLHNLSLDSPLDTLFRGLHKDCIQRKIRRAEREKLTYVSGNSEPLVRAFYGLLLRTRRRHGLPPQPLDWFRCLVKRFGDDVIIRLASKDDCPVAAVLTLSHRDKLSYKYGCSDERFHSLGGMQFLLWKSIEEAKNRGLCEFDLGRTDADQKGLVEFKDRLGAQKKTLTYWRCPRVRTAEVTHRLWGMKMARRMFSRFPAPLLAASGRLLYRHIG